MRENKEIVINDIDYIIVHRFYDAPKYLRNLSDNGGDEDWIALVPEKVLERCGGWIGWLESGTSFGCCDVQEIFITGGRVYIGSHA